MPAYGSSAVQILDPGIARAVWSAEQPANGVASQAVCLRRDGQQPRPISADILFDADPGAMTIALQTADVDVDAHYVTKASLDNTNLNATFDGRIELTDVVARFVRLLMVSRTNAVNVTANLY